MFFKKILAALLVFATVSTTFAQDSETRGLREFDKVMTYDGVSVQLVPSDKNEVIVSGPSTEKVTTQVSGTTLKIKMSFGSNFKGEDNHIVVYYTNNLKEIKATEGSSVTSNHVIKSDNEIVIRSIEGADIDLEVDIKNVTSKIATGGEVKLSGKSENISISINTGGTFEGRKLKSEYGEVSIATGGKASVNVTEVLDASVTMGGNIYYYGDTKTVNESISLGGSIVSK